MHQPKQLQLFELFIQPEIKAIHDPYWDELEAQRDDIVGEQLSILATQATNTVGEQLHREGSPCSCVGEQVASDTLKVAHQHDAKLYPRLSTENHTHWVEKYWVERGINKYWYYRYTWMEVRKLNRVYIGSVRSRSSQLKKEAVELAIINGESPQEIKQLIRDFTNWCFSPPSS